ncbi:hypothetical protein H6G74_26385 [Nostoc spongiaeforme FACHB-130]|uniref:Uncharacterized protein n=1 Tax=Nostoc spongiaeforme FACHB-130 TaxID=1357510 RepID=A0ABR8G3M5_9NOSO|nr:hypothetical protein [Nostoc spongiaeforme FACHB-130]
MHQATEVAATKTKPLILAYSALGKCPDDSRTRLAYPCRRFFNSTLFMLVRVGGLCFYSRKFYSSGLRCKRSP